VRLADIPTAARREIRSKLTLRNPEFDQRTRAGAETGGTPEIVTYYTEERSSGAIVVPRGALAVVKAAAARARVDLAIEDLTLTLPETCFRFVGDLRLYQLGAAFTALNRWSNVIDAPAAAGKTVIGLWLAAQRKQPCLVIVPTKKLLEQWWARAREFLAIDTPIGIIGDGKVEIGAELTIGIINSVAEIAGKLSTQFGHLIVDECHRAPGERYFSTISAIHARYLLGLSATAFRRDGLTPVIGWLLGPTIKVDRGPLVKAGAILPAEIEQRPTEFGSDLNASDHYGSVITELIANPERNKRICADVAHEMETCEDVILLLSDRKGHCGLIIAYMELLGVEVARMTGDMSKAQAEFYQKALEKRTIRVIAATTQFVGEGWDFPRVGVLLLITPIKFSGKLIQAVGRALRPSPGMDRARIIDYVDNKVPQLLQSARGRSRTYTKEISQ